MGDSNGIIEKNFGRLLVLLRWRTGWDWGEKRRTIESVHFGVQVFHDFAAWNVDLYLGIWMLRLSLSDK